MRYLLSIIFCLWVSCALAFPPGFIGAVTQGAAGGSGSAAYSDDFERADTNPIGSPWVTITSMAAMQIVSGTARATVSDSGSYYNGAVAVDQYSEVTFASIASYSDWAGPVVRVSSSAKTYYELTKRNSTGKLAIYKRVNGTSTLLQEYTGFTADIGVGKTLRLEASGVNPTTLTGYNNGTQIGTAVTDSDIDSGFVGMYTGTTYNATFASWIGGDL